MKRDEQSLEAHQAALAQEAGLRSIEKGEANCIKLLLRASQSSFLMFFGRLCCGHGAFQGIGATHSGRCGRVLRLREEAEKPEPQAGAQGALGELKEFKIV